MVDRGSSNSEAAVGGVGKATQMSTTFSNSLGLGDSSSYLANGPGFSLSLSFSLSNEVVASEGRVYRASNSSVHRAGNMGSISRDDSLLDAIGVGDDSRLATEKCLGGGDSGSHLGQGVGVSLCF